MSTRTRKCEFGAPTDCPGEAIGSQLCGIVDCPGESHTSLFEIYFFYKIYKFFDENFEHVFYLGLISALKILLKCFRAVTTER